jgi:hypothetical protein
MKIIILIIILIYSCNTKTIYQKKREERIERSIKMFHEVHKVRKECSTKRTKGKHRRRKPKYTS